VRPVANAKHPRRRRFVIMAAMSESPSFKPLKDIGILPINETSEIRFYVDAYKGYTYGSIRTFLKREKYSGPTKAGITLNAKALEPLITALENLPQTPPDQPDVEIARIPKKPGLDIVARVTVYKDSSGVDIREWIDDGVYQGWSKKGVRVPYAELGKTIAYLRELRAALAGMAQAPDKPPGAPTA